jgi:hypothetical protein
VLVDFKAAAPETAGASPPSRPLTTFSPRLWIEYFANKCSISSPRSKPAGSIYHCKLCPGLVTPSASRRALSRRPMTNDTAVMKRAFGPDFIKVAVLGIFRIALASVARRAFPELRNSPGVHRVMAPHACSAGLSLVSRIRVRIDFCLVCPVIEKHNSSRAPLVKSDDFRLRLLGLLRRAPRTRCARHQQSQSVRDQHCELESHTLFGWPSWPFP